MAGCICSSYGKPSNPEYVTDIFSETLSLRRTRKRWEVTNKMNARLDDPTAVLIRIPVFLDYPEEGDSKLSRNLWNLPDNASSCRIRMNY
jgi:hypothetical protein